MMRSLLLKWNLRRLTSRKAEVRCFAVSELAELAKRGNTRAVEPLINALDDESHDDRHDVGVQAVWALASLSDARATKALIKVLPLARFHGAVHQALIDFADARTTDLLIQALGDEDTEVRFRVARLFHKLRNPQAVAPLIKALADRESCVRYAVAEALGNQGDARAVDPLITALVDQDACVRNPAAEALGKIGDAHAVTPLINALVDQDAHVRRNAAAALSNLGQHQWCHWIQGDLEDFSRLATGGDPHAVELLIKALSERAFNVQAAVAKAVGLLDDARVPALLMNALLEDYPGTKKEAAIALGKLGDTRAVEPLIKALSDNWLEVTVAAADALGELGDARAIEPLVRKLDGIQEVSYWAAIALGKLGDTRAVERLVDASNFGNFWVKSAAQEMLHKLGYDMRGKSVS